MNWDAIGAIGEIVGALTVVATLVYLAIQIRQNSSLAKATIRENRTGSSQSILFALRDAADILVKRHQGEELTPGDTLRLEFTCRAMFRDFEAYAYQKHSGLLDDSEWAAMLETWRDTMGSEYSRELWEKYKYQYSSVLHDHLAEILSEPASRA